MNANYINSIGLLFDIAGVLVLFKYGLPSEVSKEGSIGIAFQGTDLDEVKKWKKYDCWSKFGLSIILIGFLLQLSSNWIDELYYFFHSIQAS
jgi:hypothetical protein